MRGAWIEIPHYQREVICLVSLPMRGAWIEINTDYALTLMAIGRSPCGERGLKYTSNGSKGAAHEVAPHAGSVD